MDVKIKNYMVGCVDKIIDEKGGELGICMCDACRTDVTAIVLNKLGYSLYDVCDEYDDIKLIRIKVEKENEILEKIKEANAIVSKNPRHDKQEDVLVIRNYMEDCTIKMAEKMIEERKLNMKKIGAISASALNKLPAKYVVSRKGELFSKISTMEAQFNIDIITAIATAIGELKQQGAL